MSIRKINKRLSIENFYSSRFQAKRDLNVCMTHFKFASKKRAAIKPQNSRISRDAYKPSFVQKLVNNSTMVIQCQL